MPANFEAPGAPALGRHVHFQVPASKRFTATHLPGREAGRASAFAQSRTNPVPHQPGFVPCPVSSDARSRGMPGPTPACTLRPKRDCPMTTGPDVA